MNLTLGIMASIAARPNWPIKRLCLLGVSNTWIFIALCYARHGWSLLVIGAAFLPAATPSIGCLWGAMCFCIVAFAHSIIRTSLRGSCMGFFFRMVALAISFGFLLYIIVIFGGLGLVWYYWILPDTNISIAEYEQLLALAGGIINAAFSLRHILRTYGPKARATLVKMWTEAHDTDFW